MRDAVICEPLRTPVGGFGGSLRDVPAHELAATVIRGLLERTGIAPDAVHDVILGHCYPSMDAPAIGRVAALDAGLPVTVTGLQIDRRCGSGLQAVLYAAMQVRSGASEVVLAGGAESMSNAPFYSTAMRWGVGSGPGVLLNDALARGRVTAGGAGFPVPGGMIETAENVRRDHGISRAEQDEYAARSHQRAAAARAAGRFTDEIVPVVVRSGRSVTVVDTDEHIRADSTVAKLATLRPILGRDDPQATVTAGNSSGQNDGAAICLVTHPNRAAELGLRPLARVVSWGLGGVPPATMGMDRFRPRRWRWRRPGCARWCGAKRDTAWRPCASAVARASRPSSNAAELRSAGVAFDHATWTCLPAATWHMRRAVGTDGEESHIVVPT
jgi:acetyl-CoA C-acetyltransferase